VSAGGDGLREDGDLLMPIYGWFTDGFDAPVLKEAKLLLEQLTPRRRLDAPRSVECPWVA
jgi:hypothetical protein